MRYFMALVCLLLYPSLTWAAAGQVESASGNVWDIRGQQTLTLASGAEVQAGDVIRTGKMGKVRLVMRDDSVVFLGPRSRLRIDRYDMDQQGLVAGTFYLMWGKVRFLVNKLKRASASFSVSTQTANIGVRGTEFGVIVPLPSQSKSPFTEVLLFKGIVVGRSLEGGTVVMKPGQFVHFTVSGAPQERNITPKDVQQLGISLLAPGLVEPKPIHSPPKPMVPDNDQMTDLGGMGHPPHPSHPAHPPHLIHPSKKPKKP